MELTRSTGVRSSSPVGNDGTEAGFLRVSAAKLVAFLVMGLSLQLLLDPFPSRLDLPCRLTVRLKLGDGTAVHQGVPQRCTMNDRYGANLKAISFQGLTCLLGYRT